MLPSLLKRHDNPWWLSRPTVLAALLGTVVLPALVPRTLKAVAKLSSFSVCMLFLLASAISSLAVVAGGHTGLDSITQLCAKVRQGREGGSHHGGRPANGGREQLGLELQDVLVPVTVPEPAIAGSSA